LEKDLKIKREFQQYEEVGNMRHHWAIAVTIVWLMAVIGCGGARGPVEAGAEMKPQKASEDEFYRTARLIMTKEERDIYKHLPDEIEKRAFIKEFWKKRDPNPETEDNETKIEFDTRIAYANKHFRETPKGPGWDTERGRFLLQLGFPDERRWGEKAHTYRGRLLTSKRTPMEVWVYLRYRLTLVFADYNDSGRLRLQKIPSNLQTVIDMVGFSLDLRNQDKLKTAFKFGLKYKDGNLNVTVPAKKIDFIPKDEKMTAHFGITVYVYRNSIKVDELTFDKLFNYDPDELLKTKKIHFSLPCPISEKGKYYFDVVIEDKHSSTRYRNFAGHRK
jgi:GWxTD domain-containing protein